MATSQLNRRRSDRIPSNLKIESINSIDCSYSVLNVSKNGFFIETDIIYDIGSKFILTFKLPDSPMPISAYCQVLWNKFAVVSNEDTNGIGVKFINISEFDRKRLQKFLVSIQPSQDPKINSDTHTLMDFSHASKKSFEDKTAEAYSYINDMKEKGYYTYRRPLVSPANNRVLVYDSKLGKTREMIMMASNNYLGLADHPKVKEAASEAIKKYGLGTASAPMLSGTFELHEELEEKLANFVGMEKAIIFSSGYSAGVGCVSGCVSSNDLAIVDRLAHACLIDGCMMSGVKLRTFNHNNAESLEKVLERNSDYENKLIVIEGTYSMEGDHPYLPDFYEVAKKHKAKILLDEAHSLGVFGKDGSGLATHYGLKGKIDIFLGTFSKSLGQMGGFVASSKEVINYLRHYGRSYFFSASPPPVIVASVLQALELLKSENGRRENLWKNIEYFRNSIINLGFKTFDQSSAVIPIVVGEDEVLKKMSARLHEEGVYLNPIPYPAAPRGGTLFRISLMATHTREDLDIALEALEKVGKEFGVIGNSADIQSIN